MKSTGPRFPLNIISKTVFMNIFLPLLICLFYFFFIKVCCWAFSGMKTLFSLPTFLKIFFFTLVWLTFCFTCVLRSTLHRVLVNGQERYSVRPLFYFSPFFLSENCCKTLISFWWPLLIVSVSAISSYKGSTLFSICFLFYLLLAAGMFFWRVLNCVTNVHLQFRHLKI